jgi:8-hydroxy-5-deazaflavin:NADPH oxidoreductase
MLAIAKGLRQPEFQNRRANDQYFFCRRRLGSKTKSENWSSALAFDPVEAGPLQSARYLEPLSLLKIHLCRALGFGTHIGFALLRDGRP